MTKFSSENLTKLHSHQDCTRGPISLCPYKHWVLSTFRSSLVSEAWGKFLFHLRLFDQQWRWSYLLGGYFSLSSVNYIYLFSQDVLVRLLGPRKKASWTISFKHWATTMALPLRVPRVVGETWTTLQKKGTYDTSLWMLRVKGVTWSFIHSAITEPLSPRHFTRDRGYKDSQT